MINNFELILKTALYISFLIVIASILIEKNRVDNCIKSCFYKEKEIWCEMNCWSYFDKYNINISDYKLPTECEAWGGKYPFLCRRD
jgi:hypothetical protein